MVGKTLNQYEILELLGTGGMGEVYRARDTNLKRDVAIKVLPQDLDADPDRLARLEREAHLLAALTHPNIATIHNLEEAEGTRFLVLELVKGESLGERLSRGALPVPEVLELGKQIAEALEAAHNEGIIHRDLKPANILITPEGRVKVLDFGLAKTIERAPGDVDLSHSPTVTVAGTEAGVIMGTAPYMSPEQVRGGGVDKSADIWAFGCVLYEMLTGKRAFSRATVADTLAAVLEHEPDWEALPAATPPAVASLLQRCLRKDVDRRTRDIRDARIDMEEARTEPISATMSGVRPSTQVRGLPWAMIGAVTGTATVAVALTIFLSGIGRDLATVPSELVPLTFDGGTKLNPRLSPDGTMVAFDWDNPDGDSRDIYVKQTDPDATAIRVTRHPNREYGAVWSPSGEDLAFVRVLDPQAGAEAAIYRVKRLGGDERKLVDVAFPAPRPNTMRPSWSPDGRTLAYAEQFSAEESSRIVLLDVASKLPRDFTTPPPVSGQADNNDATGDSHPVFSPDGRRIAFVRRAAAFGNCDVWIQDIDSDTPDQLTSERWIHCRIEKLRVKV